MTEFETKFELQANSEPTTVVLTHSGRQVRLELSPEIGGIGRAIEAWKKCGGQHRIWLGSGRVDMKTLEFSDWLLAQDGVQALGQAEPTIH